MKLKMMDTPEESDEEQELETHPTGDSNTNTGGSVHEKRITDFKVDLPTFEGKNDPDEFLEWLETVERVFDFKDVPEDKKVKLVALKLRKYASTWWTNTSTKRRREGKAPVKTWLKMRALMKKKFLPEQYVRDNFARLQQLRQGTRTVEDYTREFEELLMRCDLQEDDSQTLVRYLFGLNTQIANVVELQTYDTFEELSKLALKVESQLKRSKTPFGRPPPFSKNTQTTPLNNGSDYYPYHEEPPYDTPSRNFGYSPCQDSDGDNYYEPHGDHDDYDQFGPMCDDQSDPLVEEIIRLEQKIFYFDELLFAEGSWYEPPYSRDYTLFAEEQIEANKVAIRERAKLLESVTEEKEFERRLHEGSKLMQKMLNDFQRERLEAEAKADKLVNDLCKAVEHKRSLPSQDQMREINVQKEALEPKTNPEPINQQVPDLEDSPSFTPSQKPESITTLARATVVILPESLPSQVPASIVVHEVEPIEGPDSEPPTLIQEKGEEVLPTAINDHLLNCVEDTPPEEPVLEEVEPITYPQDTNVQVSEQESIDEELFCMEKPTPLIETCVHHASSEDSDHTFFDSLLDGYDYVCPKDGWNLKSWDELLESDDEDSSLGEGTIIIIKPQMDSQPIEAKEEINFAIKANDVDLLRRLPPPPTYQESPPFFLLPPSRRDESKILDLDRATNQTRWHQKRVKRAKLYDSRIGRSRKKWMDVAWMIPHGNRRTLQNLEELPLHSEEARKRFLTWGNTKMLQPPMVLDPAYLDELGHWQDIDEFLYNPKWRILLFLQAPASLEVTIEFLCSLRFLNDGEEVRSTAEVTSTTKLTFTLMGRLLSLTVADLVWLIGLYTLDETRSLEFANLPDRLDPEFDVRKFWQAHGYGRYHSGASIARNWVRPSWRILHHALTHSYFGHSHGSDVVFDSDMLFFWSLEARVPVNLATFVARFLFAQSTSNHQFVLCGPMVTLLARGLCMTVPNVLPEAASIFRPSTRYLTQIAYNKEDKEARPRK
ncbi:unnamed protein product [Cuscuta campestris]|uniref:Retrotransposon gag domain-containing protein n=1 Tax=Cuscuta campestris TaxID=132261 RepID=A0A484NB58_9ASTE|nr:unnamed protein product [Cuscuta campestris]